MNRPYLPVLFEELQILNSEQIENWISHRVRIFGILNTLFDNDEEVPSAMTRKQTSSSSSVFRFGDKIVLEDPFRKSDTKIMLDFELVPDLYRKFNPGYKVQVLGEIKACQG